VPPITIDNTPIEVMIEDNEGIGAETIVFFFRRE